MNTEGWWIRPALAVDAPVLARLEAEIFGPDAWSLQAVRDELAPTGDTPLEPDTRRLGTGPNAERAGLVMLDGEDIVGYAFLRITDGVAEVLRIAVQPSVRRRGGGTNLMQSLLDFARQRKCVQVLLEVAADDQGAQAFYAQLGFASVYRRPRYYHGQVDAVVMGRHI